IFIYYLHGLLFNKKIDINNYANDDGVKVTVDEVNNNPEDKIVRIRGWAIKLNQDLQTVETYVALKNVETLEVYKISTIEQDRSDVTDYFKNNYDDTHNYNHSGFIGRVDKRALKNNGKYQICILYLSDKNNALVPTEKFVTIN
uniref:hypothetical protein n=1 Tax=Clostridium saccharoperbutylacetonicum TaxID=36745 RepID=UPI000559449F